MALATMIDDFQLVNFAPLSVMVSACLVLSAHLKSVCIAPLGAMEGACSVLFARIHLFYCAAINVMVCTSFLPHARIL